MSTLIRQASIIAMDERHGSTPFVGDILIEDDRIKAIGPDLEQPPARTVLDGRDRLVMPGLVNAHLHSWEDLFKGRYDNLPLELWMLYSLPDPRPDADLRPADLPADDARGDGLAEARRHQRARRRARDAGAEPRPARHGLPGLRGRRHPRELSPATSSTGRSRTRSPTSSDMMPQEILDEVKAGARAPSTDDFVDFAKKAIERFHDRAGRLRYVIAPSGPQRCTEDTARWPPRSSRGSTARPTTSTSCETKMQAVTGREFYGKTLIRYMHDVGALTERTTIAHSVWVTDEDIELMARAAAASSHNADLEHEADRRHRPVPQALGRRCQRRPGHRRHPRTTRRAILDVMKIAALIHKVTTPRLHEGPDGDRDHPRRDDQRRPQRLRPRRGGLARARQEGRPGDPRSTRTRSTSRR